MPSYPSECWDDEWAAWWHLERRGFTQHRCVIRPPDGKRLADFDFNTREAVNYLCGEWDWAYLETEA